VDSSVTCIQKTLAEIDMGIIRGLSKYLLSIIITFFFFVGWVGSLSADAWLYMSPFF